MAEKVARARKGGDVVFEHVAESAQPFLAAMLAREVPRRAWIVCADVRTQELFHNELLQWLPDALFFPEADLAPVEGAVADPETSAERLGIIQTLATSKARVILVLTRRSLDD